jgi:hypothetical protein
MMTTIATFQVGAPSSNSFTGAPNRSGRTRLFKDSICWRTDAGTPVPLAGLKSRPGVVKGPARAVSAPEATYPTPTASARSTAFLHALCSRVAAKSSKTAAGSRSSATTRMNHRSTVSLSAPSSVARYLTGPKSASTFRRSLSTVAFSTLRPAGAFVSTVSLPARLLRVACRRFVVCGAELGDRRRAQGDGPN